MIGEKSCGLLALLALGAIHPRPAEATAFCTVVRTADGFVALRARPGQRSPLVARMAPDDEVMIGAGRRGDWIEVTWWRGDERLSRGHGAHAGRGWVNRNLVSDCG